MALWEFVLLYLAGFALLQLVVYRFLRGRSGNSSTAPGDSPTAHGDSSTAHGERPRGETVRSETPVGNLAGYRVGPRERAGRDGATEESRRCPHCGTPNEPEPSYTFCRHCAGSLAG